jgi:hypothetical protein
MDLLKNPQKPPLREHDVLQDGTIKTVQYWFAIMHQARMARNYG